MFSAGMFAGLRRVDGQAQARVHPRVAAARTGGNGDLADQLREVLAALVVIDGLLALDLRPLAMPRHGHLLVSGKHCAGTSCRPRRQPE
jgi:hypothetical protein